MRLLFSSIAHLLVTFARLARPGGLGAVAAESFAGQTPVAHHEACATRPKLTSWDRLASSICSTLGFDERQRPNKKYR
jgi:hypothetical protein